MAVWRISNWLTKHTNKESTFHNIAIQFTHHNKYSSSNTPVGTIAIFTAIYLCNNGCVKCSNVLKCALLVCVYYVSQCLHPAIPITFFLTGELT